MGSPTPLTAVAKHVAETSGNGPATVAFGISNQILESLQGVRVNASVAEALSRRMEETTNFLSALLEEDTKDPGLSDFVENIGRFLSKARGTLEDISRQSYLSQLFHRDHDRERLQDVSRSIQTVFDAFMVDLRLRTGAQTATLSKQVEAMLSRQPVKFEDISNGSEGAIPAQRLPPNPRLHFGRTEELLATVAAVAGQDAGHIAILGGPGMGKTTLSLAALHHPSVVERFGANRFFVRCDSVVGQTNCLSVVASAFGIVDTEIKATQKRLLSLLGGSSTLVVLDNFESAWESPEQRGSAEQLLQLLSSVEKLSLIVTLRGTERPAGIQWRRPFLPALTSLGDTAARHIFVAIADVADADPALDALLRQLDNVPLAVVLMANLAQAESPESLLRRWTELETAMLHRGGKPDRTSSVDISIELSVRSARMRAAPKALRLLSLLALLPNGATDVDIRLWDGEYTKALAVLLRTSLAVQQTDNRVYVLAPVRSFMLANHPPNDDETIPIYDHYFGLTALVLPVHTHSLDPDALSLVAAEMGNIDAIVRFALKHSRRDIARAIQAVDSLSRVHVASGIGSGPELLPLAASMAHDAGLDDLHADLLLRWARVSRFSSVSVDPMDLARRALNIYERTGNARGTLAARIYLICSHPHDAAIAEARLLFMIAEAQGDRYRMASCAQELAALLTDEGDHVGAIESHRLAISLAETATGSKAGHERLIGDSMFLIADCSDSLGNMADAIEMYNAALCVYEAEGYVNGIMRVHVQLAEAYRSRGALRAAIQHAEHALAVKGAEAFRYYSTSLLVLAEARALAGQYEAAKAAVNRAYQLEVSKDLPPSILGRILYTQGTVAYLSGDLEEARAVLLAARTVARRTHPLDHPALMRYVEAHVVEALSDVEVRVGRAEEALTLAITAAALFRTSSPSVVPIGCLVLLSEVVSDDAAAVALLDAVLLPLQKAGNAHGIAKALVRSAKIARERGQFQLARRRAGNALKHLGEIQDERYMRAARSLLQDC